VWPWEGGLDRRLKAEELPWEMWALALRRDKQVNNAQMIPPITSPTTMDTVKAIVICSEIQQKHTAKLFHQL